MLLPQPWDESLLCSSSGNNLIPRANGDFTTTKTITKEFADKISGLMDNIIKIEFICICLVLKLFFYAPDELLFVDILAVSRSIERNIRTVLALARALRIDTIKK